MSAKTFENDFLPNPIIKSNSTGPVLTTPPGLNVIVDALSVPLSVTILCDGSDVEVGFLNDGSLLADLVTTDNRVSNGSDSQIQFFRDGVQLNSMYIGQNNGTSLHELSLPASTFRFIDTPPAGSHTYTAKINVDANATNNNSISNWVLYAKKFR